jgi:hypothetical protein
MASTRFCASSPRSITVSIAWTAVTTICGSVSRTTRATTRRRLEGVVRNSASAPIATGRRM